MVRAPCSTKASHFSNCRIDETRFFLCSLQTGAEKPFFFFIVE